MPVVVRQTLEFANWHRSLGDHVAQDAITARLLRMESGLKGDTKSVGGKVAEARIDVGPGYRLYFTKRGLDLIVMLGGGDKSTQKGDIERAKAMVRKMDESEKGKGARARKTSRRGGKR